MFESGLAAAALANAQSNMDAARRAGEIRAQQAPQNAANVGSAFAQLAQAIVQPHQNLQQAEIEGKSLEERAKQAALEAADSAKKAGLPDDAVVAASVHAKNLVYDQFYEKWHGQVSHHGFGKLVQQFPHPGLEAPVSTPLNPVEPAISALVQNGTPVGTGEGMPQGATDIGMQPPDYSKVNAAIPGLEGVLASSGLTAQQTAAAQSQANKLAAQNKRAADRIASQEKTTDARLNVLEGQLQGTMLKDYLTARHQIAQERQAELDNTDPEDVVARVGVQSKYDQQFSGLFDQFNQRIKGGLGAAPTVAPVGTPAAPSMKAVNTKAHGDYLKERANYEKQLPGILKQRELDKVNLAKMAEKGKNMRHADFMKMAGAKFGWAMKHDQQMFDLATKRFELSKSKASEGGGGASVGQKAQQINRDAQAIKDSWQAGLKQLQGWQKEYADTGSIKGWTPPNPQAYANWVAERQKEIEGKEAAFHAKLSEADKLLGLTEEAGTAPSRPLTGAGLPAGGQYKTLR